MPFVTFDQKLRLGREMSLWKAETFEQELLAKEKSLK